MNPQGRIRKLNNNDVKPNGPVIYWMSRDQRINQNHALHESYKMALERKSELHVIFCLQKQFLGCDQRIFDFMLTGLQKIEKDLCDLNIRFELVIGHPMDEVLKYQKNVAASVVFTDYSPLRIGRKWRDSIASKIDIPFYEVDTHNIVPIWEASNKREFSARTIRPKINSKLSNYLHKIADLKRFPYNKTSQNHNNSKWQSILSNDANNLQFESGEIPARSVLNDFIKNKLSKYPELKNDPNEYATSNLSPYLHFGQISSLQVALEIISSDAPKISKDTYLEELVIRKELAENFCHYTKEYDSTSSFPSWAKKTLSTHLVDKRDFIYSLESFENAKTHDPLWNAAQIQMIETGNMHGYMRMYWAKKILEWSKSPEEALHTAIYLNDKYEFDGRDPNGYAGIAWSIGGVHDRPWFERPIFGLIRYMNRSGAEKKFDVEKYIKTWLK
ncbi:MAG: deoxyribodipyrimidine photo-lyase [Patescibacteria group bacterium]